MQNKKILRWNVSSMIKRLDQNLIVKQVLLPKNIEKNKRKGKKEKKNVYSSSSF